MKGTLYSIVLGAVVCCWCLGTPARSEERATVTGEVIDSACYIKMGARGPDHAKCAAACGKAGVPLALVTDEGEVVWLSSTNDMESVNGMLAPYVAKKVTLEGRWFERGGTKLFEVAKVTEAAPG